MTSVLPAWKLELIEKKKKKEQDQRQKLDEEKSRKISIPEWKRSLLEKKKEIAIDSPETKEQALRVNSVFGPRIVRKASQTNTLVVNSSYKPVVRDGDEDNKRKILHDINMGHGAPALFSSPTDTNSCVTKAVEIPTEVEHKLNKLGTRIEVESNRESSQQSDVITNGEDSKVTLDVNQSDSKPGNDIGLVKTPSVLSYRRMFEQSKPERNRETNEPQIVKNTEGKAHIQGGKGTTENTSGPTYSEPHHSQLQILNKSTVDNAQSIPDSEKSTYLHADSIERKVSTPKPSFAPKPYKSFVTTPPWLKHSAPRNVAFQTGQEDLEVANVNNELQSASKDVDTSGHKDEVVVESNVKSKGEDPTENVDEYLQRISFNNYSDLVIPSTNDEHREESLQTSAAEKTVVPQEESVQKYSIIKDADLKEAPLAPKSDKVVENQKYILIDGRSQQEQTPSNNKDKTSVSAITNNVSQVPHEIITPMAKDVSRSSSIESLRSKFGAVGGFRKRTPSEENLFLKGNQAEPLSEHGYVIRRSAELKRPPPPMKRWSADILSLMSKPIDDNDISNLSPRSDSKFTLSSTSGQLRRPPPPMKRWTADVLSVMSQQVDDSMSNFSPRSDSSKKSSPRNSLDRGRSSSLIDITREEANHDCFQHKSNVAHGIEHRVNKLIRRASVSELQLIVDSEESDSTSDDDPISEAFLQGSFDNEITTTDHTFTLKEKDAHSPPAEHLPEQVIKPVFARKHSISSDIEHRVTELFHRQLSQQSDGDESEGDKTSESDSKVTVVQIVDSIKEPIPEKLKTETVPAVSTKSVDFDCAPTEAEPKEDSDHTTPENKPVRGSVHKLSALFGSSIWKPNKKDKVAHEEKNKNKASEQDKPHTTEKSNQKSTSGEKGDSKKSNLFKSNKTEAKSTQKEKQQSNTNIFPWLKKKNSKEKESTAGHKTKEVLDKNQKNSGNSPNESAETVSLAPHGLQPVRKTEKVEQRLVGKVVIISNASHEKTPPKGVYHKPKPSAQISELEKKEMSVRKVNDSKTDNERADTQVPAVVMQYWNGNQQSSDLQKSMSESVPITSIDEVPVSAIDLPESGDSDVTVSVIDVPASPDVRSAQKTSFFNGYREEVQHTDDISVSVIDLPSPVNMEKINTFQDGYLEADELSDGSDMDEVEGSYDFATGEVTHLVNGDITQDDEDDEDDEEEDDDEEDEEDVPISYIGAAPQYPVPQVVFDSEPVQLKSCLSPKTERRKVRFNPNSYTFICKRLGMNIRFFCQREKFQQAFS